MPVYTPEPLAAMPAVPVIEEVNELTYVIFPRYGALHPKTRIC
jgi:hypothetical protein